MDVRLDTQIAIVTGGNSGLGRATALQFAEAGADVVIDYHSEEDKADEVVRIIEGMGRKCIAVQGDMSKEANVETLFKTTVDKLGAVDILVANAGIQNDAPIGDMTLEKWNNVIGVNLTGQFMCARAAIRQFRKQGDRKVSRSIGKIICMSSCHQLIPWGGHVNYATSKGGIAMMMKTLAQEVAGEKIRINGIAPGAIKTAINEKAMEGDALPKLLKLIPYGRVGEPEDVGYLALFLASDFADYVVGSSMFIDGGMTLYPGFQDNG